MKHTPPPKYFNTFDRTHQNHISGFEVWAFLSLWWWKAKKSDEPFFRNRAFDFLKIFSWFSSKGPIRFFVFNQLEPWGAPILKPSIRLQWVRSKMLIFFRGGVCSKTLILQKMVKNQNGLDILPWVTKVRPDFGLRFSLGPFLHTTLIVDMRWTIIAEVKI